MKIHAHKLGVVLGSFYALWHASWSVLVATGTAKPLLDWVLRLHFLSFEYAVRPFEFGRALLLVVVTSVSGYAIGWALGTVWNIAKE